MSIRYTMDAVDNDDANESYLNCGNSCNSLYLHSQYNIGGLDKPKMYSDSCYNSASDCSYGRAMENRNIATKTAGRKIFTSVILYAWRKRKNEIKKLLQSVEELKREANRTKNQLQVYSSFIRVEQKRNDDLSTQLKKTLNNVKQSRISIESLSTTLLNMKADKVHLEQKLNVKCEEYEALHSVLDQTKTDLFRSMMEQRNLQEQLCQEQRIVQTLEIQVNKLTNKICDINTEHRKVEDNLTRMLENKECDIIETKNKLMELEANLADLKMKISTDQIPKKDQITEHKQIQLLHLQVEALQNNLDGTLSHRFQIYWLKFVKYNRTILRYAQILSYYLLPATPPPTKIPQKSSKIS